MFPDHAYPFASLLNVIALHIGDVPSGVRDEALVVVTAVENGLATPGHVDRRRLLTGLTVSVSPTPGTASPVIASSRLDSTVSAARQSR